MPSLNSDNNLGIEITTSADSSGIDEATSSLQQLGTTNEDLGKKTGVMSEEFSSGMKKISVATGVVGAGLALYAKSSIDYLVNLTKESKSLALQTGMTAVQSSELIAAFQHMGLDAGQASIAFRKLAVDINNTRDKAADQALQTEALNNKLRDIGVTHDDLTLKLKANQLAIQKVTDEIAKNGDKTGALHVQLDQLNLATTKYNNQLSDLTLQTKSYQEQLEKTSGPLEKLHINTQNADGSNKSFNDILLEVADRFKEMPNGAEKSADAIALFGRTGTNMIKVLNLGSQGIKDLEDNAKRLGLTLTTDNIVAVNKYIQSQKALTETNNALKISVGTLTAPLLTDLNLKMNQLATAALAPGSPIRTLTADILAFGGPVLGATSGLAAFLGNISSAGRAIDVLKVAAVGFVGILQSPWILAFVAAAGAVGFLATQIFNNKGQTDALTVAQNNLKQSTDQLKVAQNNLADAHLNEEGAALAVEGAQRTYNEAVQQFGPGSYAARDALYNLQVAQHNLTVAQDATKDSLQTYNDKQKEVAKNQEIIAHMTATSDAINGVTRSADGAVVSINKLAQSISSNNAAGQKINLAPLLKKAKGGPVTAGTPYIVGDNPDGSVNKTSELFVPNQSGNIIPADQTQRMLKSGSGSGSGLTVNQYIYNQVDYNKGITEIGWRLRNA